MVENIFTGYIDSALPLAEYEKLEDGTFSGRITVCKGVIAFGETLQECEKELQSTLEDWVSLGLRLERDFPIIGGYDLNRYSANGLTGPR